MGNTPEHFIQQVPALFATITGSLFQLAQQHRPGTTIGAIIRDEEVMIAHDDTMIESGDHVILFVVDKKHIRDVEKLFHVGLSFF